MVAPRNTNPPRVIDQLVALSETEVVKVEIDGAGASLDSQVQVSYQGEVECFGFITEIVFGRLDLGAKPIGNIT